MKLFDIIYKSPRERWHAGMAQSVEHVIGNDEVISSILISSSRKSKPCGLLFLIYHIFDNSSIALSLKMHCPHSHNSIYVFSLLTSSPNSDKKLIICKPFCI